MIENTELAELAAELGLLLKARGCMLVLAESCTGGMIAEAVTSIAGSSAWFECGFVTYSNQSKINMLGVSVQTLEQFGAVSEQTAKEMAVGCLNNIKPSSCNANLSEISLDKTNVSKPSINRLIIAASVTGIAGPDGGTPQKPVGTVCFACAVPDLPAATYTQLFTGNRQQIRYQASIFLLKTLIKMLASV